MPTDIIKARGFNVSGTQVTLNTGKHLVLPQVNEPATPTLSFGDGDSGFYEETDDSIIFSLAGSARWKVAFDFLGSLSLSARLLAAAPSATVPSIVPVAGDADTGIGTAGADILSLIAGGVEAIRLTEVAGVVQTILPLSNTPAAPTLAFGDGDTGFYENADDSISVAIAGVLKFQFLPDFFSSGVTGGGALKTSAASATVPAILFAGDADTGLGTAGADILSLIAGAVEGHRITEAAGLINHVLTGMVKTPTTQTLTGAGAVDIVSAITHIVTTAANALTLADGAEGQHKYIVMNTDAGDGTLTPTNPGNFATIVFNDVGDSAQLLFTNGKWHFMGGTATLT